MDSKDQHLLITAALQLLEESGADVRGIVMDGSHPNQRTASMLGAQLTMDSFKPFFSHPMTSRNVYIIFDPCHMLKLLRNLLGDLGVLYNNEQKPIRWSYLKKLHNLQQNEGLHIANRLRASHIEFHSKKMNVQIAAQTLSNSVATALDFLRLTKNEHFKECEPTAEFLRHVDNLFDRLNASNPRGLGLKAPINLANLSTTTQLIEDSLSFLKELTIKSGQPVVESRRKMGVIGFMCAATGILTIAKDLLMREKDPYAYFLPYKCSQDNIETFFSMIRQRGGWNNNPNVFQVKVVI